jgi:hypothetical protein
MSERKKYTFCCNVSSVLMAFNNSEHVDERKSKTAGAPETL